MVRENNGYLNTSIVTFVFPLKGTYAKPIGNNYPTSVQTRTPLWETEILSPKG